MAAARVRLPPVARNADSMARASSASSLAGSLTVRSGYGSIDAEGELRAVNVWTSSGGIRIRARSRSRVEQAWKVASDYGDIRVALPEGMPCTLAAKSGYGDVEAEVPLEGDVSKSGSRRELRARHAGGGGSIEIDAKSGDIVIERAGGG
jgi:hypothetical protein